jgi:hypothetical protein
MIQVSDTVSTDAFCSLFGLTTYEAFCDLNMDWTSECAADVASEYEVDSEEWCEAFDTASEELWEKLNYAHEKSMKAAFHYLSEECLISTILNEDTGMITFHSEDWNKAAEIVIESINGYGMFQFDSVEDLILSGPYAGAKEAAIAHLHWHTERSNIFGEDGIKEVFSKALERELRYM